MNRHINYTDKELISGLAQNDNAAISEIYRLYQPILMKWMLTRGGNETDAYDVFQEGLMVLYEKSSDEAFVLSCKLSTYLFAVCKHIWYKKTNQRGQISSFDDIIEQNDGENDYDIAAEQDTNIHHEKELQFEKLEQSLELLGSPCNELLKAFYIEDKSMQEIAQSFGYTNAENAKTQKYKCLNRLKKFFFSTKMMVNN